MRKIKNILVAPSVLSANFANLEKDVRKVEEGGADLLHIDVMDGHFVPNITIGPVVVKAIRRITKLPLDVHLMIKNPKDYIEAFANAGSDSITFHIEASHETSAVISAIHRYGKKAGISIKPNTKITTIKPVLNKIDLVLVMSVEPGFGGQEFIESAVDKIRELRQIYNGDISVDGGINDRNALRVIQAGANILVAGSYIFGSKDYRKAMKGLKKGI